MAKHGQGQPIARQTDDEFWMRLALQAAQCSAEQAEVPVGAVLVHRPKPDGVATEIARSHNQSIGLKDPTAHAEMLVLRAAAGVVGNYRLEDCELYVTLEPCAMCAQALLHARVRRVVFGANEPKTGAAGSVLNLFAIPQLNHQTEVCGGVLAVDCATVLQGFFQQRRQHAKRVATPIRDDALRTPSARFSTVWQHFPDWSASSHQNQDVPAFDRLRLHWLDLGQKDGVVWLGLHNAQGWWPQLAPWIRRHTNASRVLVPDLIGYGQSDKPKKPEWHSLEEHARLLWAWLSSIGISRVKLGVAVGQAQLAKVMQEQAPTRVEGVEAITQDEMSILSREWSDVPYPDEGHRAAQRAWERNGWGLEQMPGQ